MPHAPCNPLRSILALACAGPLSACDTITEALGGDAESTEVAETKTDAPETKDVEKVEEKKEDPAPETKAAETKIEAPPAIPPLPEVPVPPEPQGPLVLTEYTIDPGAFFGGGMQRLLVKGKIREKITRGTMVQAKASCKDGDRVVTDVIYTYPEGGVDIAELAVDAEVTLAGSLFGQGAPPTKPSPCQIEYKIGGAGGGPSLSLGQSCWDGTQMKAGACDPPIVPQAMSEPGDPMKVEQLSLTSAPSFGTAHSLHVAYYLRFNEPFDARAQVSLKASCASGSKQLVDVAYVSLLTGAFELGAGESVYRTAGLFWDTKFGFTEQPKLCDLTMVHSVPVTFDRFERRDLYRACLRDGLLTTGACDPSVPPTPPPAPVEADSVELGDVQLALVNAWGAAEQFQLDVHAEATVRKPVDQNAGITAKITCKVGKTVRLEKSFMWGVDFAFVAPGETNLMSTQAFAGAPMEERPKSCEVELLAGPRWSTSGDEGHTLGKFCLKKDKVKKGKC